MSVSEWPVLSNLVLAEDLRQAIEDEAERTAESMNEIMRTILCNHYNLRCETIDRFGGPRPTGAGKLSLRVSPELFRALQRDKQKSGIPMQRLVRDILAEHYAMEVTPA